MKTKIYLIAIVFATITLYCGCAKDGATGPAGANGSNGNANVETFTFLNKNWMNSNSDLYLTIPQITQTVLDKGAVLVYIRLSGDNEWKVVPSFIDQVDLVIGLNYIDIYNDMGASWPNFDVKVIVIPSS